MRSIFFGFLIFLLLAEATATVNFNFDCSNSYDSMSIDLKGNNINFGCTALLLPDSIHYINGGASTSTKSSYSYKMTLNDYCLESSTGTTSGGFEWHARVISDHSGIDSKESIVLSAKNMVENGVLKAQYGNSNLNAEEEVEAEGAAFWESIEIRPNSVNSGGNGIVISEDEYQKYRHYKEGFSVEKIGEDDTYEYERIDYPTNNGNEIPKIRGFRHMINVNGYGKWGRLESNILGDTETIWKYSLESEKPYYDFGMGVKGKCNGSMIKLEMEGEASNIPKQQLPPGEIVIDIVYPHKKEIEDILNMMDEEYRNFAADSPQGPAPALWYLMNQKCYVNPIEVDKRYCGDITSEEYFIIGLGFKINGK